MCRFLRFSCALFLEPFCLLVAIRQVSKEGTFRQWLFGQPLKAHCYAIAVPRLIQSPLNCADEVLPRSCSTQASGLNDEDVPAVLKGFSATTLLNNSSESQCCKGCVRRHMYCSISTTDLTMQTVDKLWHKQMVFASLSFRLARFHADLAKLLFSMSFTTAA